MIQPPSQRDPIVDDSGRVTNVYQRWFADLSKAIGSSAPPAPPAPEPVDHGDHGTIQGLGSIQTFGVLPNIVQLSLEGDDVAPGQTFYYGTGQSSDPEESHVARGWHPVSGALAQGPGLSLTIGSDGVTTFALDEIPDAGGGTFKLLSRDGYGRLSGTSDGDTDDVPEGSSNIYFTNARADARIDAAKADPNGIASLIGGKLDAGQLPALAITETFVVNTEAAMLALDVQQGDVSVRSDLQASFILTADPASTLSNWQELLVPTGVGVASFNGRTGTVIPQTGDYTPAQVGAATAAQGAKADSAVQGSDTRLSDSREWTASTVSQAEAESGAATTRRAWTAQRVRQAIAAWWDGSAAKTMLDGLVVQSITNGDATHAPSGDAVFDALAGKQDAGFLTGDASSIRLHGGSGDASGGSLRINVTPTLSYHINNVRVFGVNPSGHLFPDPDNSRSLGLGSFRWSVVYAATGTINTSDAREKYGTRELTPVEIACAVELAAAGRIYQWKEALSEKGDEARLHCSPTVQGVMEVMESHGLDPFRYGFVCYDEWEEQPEIRDEWPDEYDDEGNIIREAGSEVTQEHHPAGDRYSLRPSELESFIAAGMARKVAALERRLAALESE